MKRNKTLVRGKPSYMTARTPENRRGTKTHRGYMLHMTRGNGAFTRDEVLCTRRQAHTAHKAYDAATGRPTHQGRVIRSILRMLNWELGQYADSLYYGHP